MTGSGSFSSGTEDNAASVPTIAPEQTHLQLEYKHSRPLTGCHWDPLDRFVWFGAEDNLVHRFDLAAKTVTSLAAHESWVMAFGTSPDGQSLYTGGYDGRLIWWPAAGDKPEPVRTVDAHQGWVRAIAVSPDGQTVVTCGNDLAIRFWNATDGALRFEAKGHDSHIYNVVFSPEGGTVFSCDLKGAVKAWDATNGQLQRDLETAKSLHKYDDTFRADIGGARSIAVSADGQKLGLGGITNVTNAFAGIGEVIVVVMDVAGGKVAQQLETKAKTRGSAWGLTHHSAGFWLGLSGGGGGGWLAFWKGDAQHEFFTLKLKSDGRGMGVSPDRSRVAVAHADMHLRTYGLYAT